MKTMKLKFLSLAIVAGGLLLGITSCKDDNGGGGTDFTSENVPGKYYGTHKLNIPNNILDALSSTLPKDTLDLEAPYDSIVDVDLTAGFEDTLDIRIVDGVVKVSSSLLDVTVDGELTGSNKIKVPEKQFETLNLGTAVTATNASVATNKDVSFSSAAIGSSTSVELRLKASKIGTFTVPLNITTSGTFTKYED